MGAAISMVLAAFNLGEWVSHDDVHGLLPIAGEGSFTSHPMLTQIWTERNVSPHGSTIRRGGEDLTLGARRGLD